MKSLLNYSLVLVNLPLICFSISNLDLYKHCGNNFCCGNLTQIGYPFWGGGLRPDSCKYPGSELTCEDDDTPRIEIMGLKYQVLDINQITQIVRLTRDDLAQGICLNEFEETTLNYKLFGYANGTQKITILYGCPSPYEAIPSEFTCRINGVLETDAYPLEGD